jgi:HD-like signal output (HDOD) protein
MDLELERRLLTCPTLPSLPAVAIEVLRLCHEEEVDLWRVAEALSRDPALVARVLRAANSVSIAARGKVSTLTRAVPLLGTNTTLALALSFSFVQGRRHGERDGFDHGAFWQRAVFSALAGRTLAEAGTPAVDPEEVFLASLLQDVGMLAFAEVFRGEYGNLWQHAGGDHDRLAALERASWGADHAEASALLARAWHLPPRFQVSARGSHGGHLAAPADPRERRFFACVALSGRLADVWVAPGGAGGIRAALDAARAALGMGAEAVEAVVSRMALAVPEAAADFDIDLGAADHFEQVRSEARRLPASLGLRPRPAQPDGSGPRVETGPALDRAVRSAFEYARAHGEPLAILVATADAPNAFASETLLAVARRSLRATDLVGLAENGQLTALLPGTDLAGARSAADRILARGAKLSPPLPVAIGIGFTSPEDPVASAARLRAAAAAASLAAGPGCALLGHDAHHAGVVA